MKDTCSPQQSTAPSTSQEAPAQSGPASDQDLYGNAAVQEQLGCQSAPEGEGTFFDRLMDGTAIKTSFPFNAAFPVMGHDVALETEIEAGVNPGTLKANAFKLTVKTQKDVVKDERDKYKKLIHEEEKLQGVPLEVKQADLADFVIEFSNEEEFSLDSLGLNIAGLGQMAVNDQGVKGSVSAGFGPVSAGLAFDGTKDPWKTSLTLGFDAFDVLFGGALEKAKKAAEKQNIDFDLGAKFDAQLDLLDNATPAVRIENLKAQFDAAIGTKVSGDETGCGDFGAKAGVSLGMETDYAEGTAEDPWSKTTGKASATLTVTLFGQTFGVNMSAEDSSSGTYLEAHEAQQRLNEVALEAAYGKVCDDIASTNEADKAQVVKTLMNYLAVSYKAADVQLKAATGVSPMADYGYGPAEEIYYYNAGARKYQVSGWSEQLRAVIGRNTQAKMLHEWLVFESSAALGGEYVTSGAWEGGIDVVVDASGNFEAFHEDGSTMLGTVNGSKVTGQWFEGSDQGPFTLQIQEDGERLWGNYTQDGGRYEFALDRR